MMTTHSNPVTGFEVTLMPPTPAAPDLFGWIRLANGTAAAGYVYLQNEPVVPRVGSDGYIVTGMPLNHAAMVLDLLRSDAELQIRVNRPGEADATVFIEPRDAAVTGERRLGLPDEEIDALGG